MPALPRRGGKVVSANEQPARLDAAYRTLDHVIQWIMSADTKAQIFLTLDGVLAGVLAANAGPISQSLSIPRPTAWLWAVGITSIVFAVTYILSILMLLIVLFPRVKTPADADKQSPLFFGAIAKMDRAVYLTKASDLDPGAIETSLLDQIYVNSTIAATKFRYLRVSVLVTVLAIVLLVADTAVLLLSTVPGPLVK